MNLLKRIETYIQDYVTLADPQYSLPIALWIIGTFSFLDFDSFPYLVINSPTKRSGKTRLGEMISFCCSNPRNMAALTGPTLFRLIESEKPTIFFDEAESLNSEAAGTMRSVLNVGYRKGQTIPRSAGDGTKEFDTYCPKAFILIGDVYDTLRDRSIVITMQRAETRKRFTFQAAKEEGKALRELIDEAVTQNSGNIKHAFETHRGLPFLMDRDEEIWTSLFCLCAVFCKDRTEELQRAASDMSAEKTSTAKRYVELAGAEDEAMDAEYGKKALVDLYSLFVKGGTVRKISSEDAVQGLKEIPTGPWRKFRGDGLTLIDLAKILKPFLSPVRIALGRGRGNQTFVRGYKRDHVERAMSKL